MSVEILPGADQLAVRAVGLIIDEAAKAIAQRGRFLLVLAGGSTPEKTYLLLAQNEYKDRIDWSKTFLFMGDERFVPEDDSRSNSRMAQRTLISSVSVPKSQVILIKTDAASVTEAASDYAKTLAAFFGSNNVPQFDLILLGLGDDGHTASLFPGAASLEIDDAWVVASPPGTLPPPVDRITMTFPILNAARHVAFLVAGGNKAEAVRDVLEDHPPILKRPSVGVQPTQGELTWLLDTGAAKLLALRQ